MLLWWDFGSSEYHRHFNGWEWPKIYLLSNKRTKWEPPVNSTWKWECVESSLWFTISQLCMLTTSLENEIQGGRREWINICSFQIDNLTRPLCQSFKSLCVEGFRSCNWESWQDWLWWIFCRSLMWLKCLEKVKKQMQKWKWNSQCQFF